MITFFHQDLRTPHRLPFEPIRTLEIGSEPEDFHVEEIPAFPFAGEGEHLYVQLEKRKSASDFIAQRLARLLGVDRKDVSYAGQKDTQAVARQWFSVYCPGRSEPSNLAEKLEQEGIFLCDQTRHTHKLRPGQLKANRFAIRLVSTCTSGTEDVAQLEQALDTLQRFGAPNYFGPQRFGRNGNNAALGRYLLERREEEFLTTYNLEAEQPVRHVRHLSPFLRRLFVTALQSKLFNQYLLARGQDYNRRLGGDLLIKGNRSFHDDGASDIEERLAQGEIELSGPLFGSKMRAARGEAGKLEQSILSQSGISLEQFRSNPLFPRAQGARRPLSFRPQDAKIDARTGRFWLYVTLPRGCYATVLIGLITDFYGAIPSTFEEGT